MTSTITYATLKDAQPDRYSEAADQFQQVLDAFEQSAVDLNQQVYQPIEYSWTGAAASAALAAIGVSMNDFNATLAYLKRFVGLMRAGAEGIGDAQAYLRAAETIAASNGWTLTPDGSAQPNVPLVVRNRSIVEQLWQAMSSNPEYAEFQDLLTRALSTAQSVDDQISAALRDPEQFGQGKTWEAGAGKAGTSATALEAKLGQAEIPAKGTSSAEVAAWWKAMGADPKLQVQLIKDQPALIGALNGLPAMVRDKANRIVLAGDIAADNAKIESLNKQADQLQAEISQLQETNKGNGSGRITALLDDSQTGALEEQLDKIRSQMGSLQSQLDALNGLQGQLDQTTTKWGPHGTPTQMPPMYLLGFDTDSAGHAIVACGNPDTAKNVAVYVPGLGTSSNSTHFGFDVQHTQNMTMQADADTGAQDNATILWLGYNAPQLALSPHAFDVAGTKDATDAAPNLSSFLTSVHAVNKDLDNLTLVGHSYGSLVVGETAKSNHLPVNNIILLGSPGVSVDSASQLNIAPSHVWAGAAAGDPVARLGYFSVPPTDPSFGGHVIKVDATGSGMGAHGEYFDTYGNSNGDDNFSSLNNIASIVTGQYGKVTSGTPSSGSDMQDIENGVITGVGGW